MKARDKLITDHISIVKIIAFKFCKKYQIQNDLDDLIQAGMIGLIEAADRFDDKKGFKFKTYAERRISGAIIDSLRKDNFVSRRLYDKQKSIDYLKELLDASGKESTIATMAKIMNLSESKINEIILLNRGKNQISIDELSKFLPNEKDKLLVLSSNKQNSLDLVLQKELSSVLKTLVNSLKGDYRKCVWLYFFEGLTMKEIARPMGVSESRVHQIIKRAMAHLKQNIKKNAVDLS